ncbi:hypothetical protein EMIHUDRAFT_232308 [Emiliania huxleyi CCMP1516]|uniref:Uncharacterized protein n=2 Tax=Emiliania huxleyi TaxID=2903 RepID=A0A0D3K556_EMIH1|nr:hypothetical protein EMIHUDRAFT_232308 [Emiliania huxleyi CCMP1516]EOD30891.1 hypothetical protein EMIHUDRAFT_232308 [Emiliania huxleyi CCMP1516]|eukprot:XP_005783320.1 hypothetical protein EMIHUDRAFT_232308 [Emiliania huxleyi CCMP1516]
MCQSAHEWVCEQYRKMCRLFAEIFLNLFVEASSRKKKTLFAERLFKACENLVALKGSLEHVVSSADARQHGPPSVASASVLVGADMFGKTFLAGISIAAATLVTTIFVGL